MEGEVEGEGEGRGREEEGGEAVKDQLSRSSSSRTWKRC